jgi:hypothetical protein
LLTHRGGFPEQFIGVSARDATSAQSLEEFLTKRMPPLVFQPGEFISYSNNGYALLGQVIEDVSGQSFAEYMVEHILVPLGMTRSRFPEPLPAEIATKVATGHLTRGGELERLPWDVLHASPAGGLVTTARDMARFMTAQLQGGQHEGGRILSEASAQAMQRRQFSHDPHMPGLGYGFWERFQNGKRAILHDGGWQGFSSLMFLLPEEKLGIFIAANSLQNPPSAEFTNEFVRKFVDYFFPVDKAVGTTDVPIDAEAVEARLNRARRAAGAYRSLRIPPPHTFEKVLVAALQTSVRANDDGTLSVAEPFGEASRWIEVEPFVYRQADGEERILFREDDGGEIRYLVPSGSVMEKVPWHDDAAIQLTLFAMMVVVFALVPIGWVIGVVIGKLRDKTASAGLPGGARLFSNLLCVLNVVFVIGLLAIFDDYPQSVIYGVSGRIVALFALPIISAALTAGCVACTVALWWKRLAEIGARLRYSLFTLLSVAFLVLLNHWNLLGFHF